MQCESSTLDKDKIGLARGTDEITNCTLCSTGVLRDILGAQRLYICFTCVPCNGDVVCPCERILTRLACPFASLVITSVQTTGLIYVFL
jgi:hypothetical protein